MSISSSIFQKPCPACAANVSVGADRCHCGHIFESSQDQSPQEAALRDEELYESYLNARAQQAQQAADTAKRELAEIPNDPELIAAAELAQEVARSIEADLVAQRSKIAALRRALPPKQIALPPLPKAEPIVISRPKPVAVAPVTVTPAPVRTTPVPAVAVAVVAPQPPHRPELAAVRPTPTPVSAPTPNKTVRANAPQKAAEVLAALKSAKAREVAKRAREAMEAEAKFTKQVVADPDILVQNVQSNIPPPAFRQDQAAKAERAMETQKAVEDKECPNCTAMVPMNTSRCHCGFAFISVNTELPSLTLCTGDFTALRNSFKLNLR